MRMLFRQRGQHAQDTDTENMVYSSFSRVTLGQKGTEKGRVAWGQILKGFKKQKFNHRSQSVVLLLVWYITENDDAKQKCQRECWGSGLPLEGLPG